MSKIVLQVFTCFCVFLLLILFALSFADNGLDGEGGSLLSLDDGVGGLDDGGTVSVGSVDDGSVGSVDTIVPIQLPNSSFEQGTESPLNWTPLSLELYETYQIDTEVSSLGQRSLVIFGTRFDYGRWESDAVSVQQGGYSWYSLTGDVKTASSNGKVYLSLAWFDKDGAMLTTSDSDMLPLGDNDWQSVAVNALPPAGATTLRVWCISNHNEGYTWFDNIALQLTQLPAQGKVSYEQFLEQYPAHRFVLDAMTMEVRSLMTEAKWIREAGFYDPAAQLKSAKLYAEAASVKRNDLVLQQSTLASGKDLSAETERFESLIDSALNEAIKGAHNGDDSSHLRQYLSQVASRDRSPELTSLATTWINELDTEGDATD